MSTSIDISVLVKFAFPRTGSHLFTYTLGGLYDVQFRDIFSGSPTTKEVQERVEELNPAALHALKLRDCVGARPLVLVRDRNGMHGKPGGYIAGEKTVILTRDPIATAYSYYRVQRDRWAPADVFNEESLAQNLNEYSAFYDAALDYKAAYPDSTYFLRYEEAVRSPQAFEGFVTFLGLEPKLSPSFVWNTTRFGNFVNPGERTFYREGNNNAWRKDTHFGDMLKQVGAFDFRRFGYAGPLYLNYAQNNCPATAFAGAG